LKAQARNIFIILSQGSVHLSSLDWRWIAARDHYSEKRSKEMKRRLGVLLVVLVIALLTVIPASAAREDGRGAAGVIYVTSQGLYYDTYTVADPLPFQGRFQKLENGMTEFGPGDPGYLGGRWWVDTNNNGVMDSTDHYFLCPLLGPGRTTR
jgi:hypothetical protein